MYIQSGGFDSKSNANLRDHMDDLELIFSMLGERVTTEISKDVSGKDGEPEPYFGTYDGFLTSFNLGKMANISSLFIEFQKYLYMKKSA